MNYNEKRRMWLGRNLAILLADNEKNEADKKRRLQQGPNPETKRRMEIHQYIKYACNEGKSKEEIIDCLNVKFAGEEYNIYRQYFSSWIEHAMKKVNIKGEER